MIKRLTRTSRAWTESAGRLRARPAVEPPIALATPRSAKPRSIAARHIRSAGRLARSQHDSIAPVPPLVLMQRCIDHRRRLAAPPALCWFSFRWGAYVVRSEVALQRRRAHAQRWCGPAPETLKAETLPSVRLEILRPGATRESQIRPGVLRRRSGRGELPMTRSLSAIRDTPSGAVQTLVAGQERD